MLNVDDISSPNQGLALVAEGGGQRGAFTAGVLDSWLISNFNPFEILIGTSAGAQNIASYLSKQTGYAYSLISNLTSQTNFFNPWRLLSTKNVMDLDWYFNKTVSTTYQFDSIQADISSQNRKVRFSTSTEFTESTYATKLMNPVTEGWLESLKHSSAIPFLYKSKNLIDGGVTAPVPVHEAFNLGAKTIITIRTTNSTGFEVPKSIQRLKPILCNQRKCPKFIDILDKHESAYNTAEMFIQRPPSSVNIIEIKPQKPLATKVLGSTPEAITSDYKYGLAMGKAFIESKVFNSLIH